MHRCKDEDLLRRQKVYSFLEGGMRSGVYECPQTRLGEVCCPPEGKGKGPLHLDEKTYRIERLGTEDMSFETSEAIVRSCTRN
jgi:hypothetical protein